MSCILVNDFYGNIEMKSFFISLVLVIVNPYRGLDYSRINVYVIDEQNYEILLIKPEKDKSNKKVRYEMQFCFICNPPQYAPVEVWE